MSELTKCNHDYCYHEYMGLSGVKCLKCENKHLTARLATADLEIAKLNDECGGRALTAMDLREDNEKLRGLLREACEYEVWISHGEREYALSADLRKRITAALESKS